MTKGMVEDFQEAYSRAIQDQSATVSFRSTRNVAVIIPVADIIEVTIESWRGE